MISTVPSLLVGNPKVPVQNLQELIALARAKPGALTMAIGGIAVETIAIGVKSAIGSNGSFG
jgi:tripartite-type tricarboxylate transporter receptor subunit TctC